jgi:hypothetical protein
MDPRHGAGRGHMKQLKRRLQRLESRLMDNSRCMPYSEEWFSYWAAQTERLLDGDDSVPRPPIAFFDVILRDHDREMEAGRTKAGESDSARCAKPKEVGNP